MSTRGVALTRKGSALSSGVDGEVEDVTMCCDACGSVQTQQFGADEPMRAAIAGAECMFCRRIGAMRRVRRSA